MLKCGQSPQRDRASLTGRGIVCHFVESQRHGTVSRRSIVQIPRWRTDVENGFDALLELG